MSPKNKGAPFGSRPFVDPLRSGGFYLVSLLKVSDVDDAVSFSCVVFPLVVEPTVRPFRPLSVT